MKVKVTSLGITRKGTNSHIIIRNDRHQMPTMTTISSQPSSISIPRVPNKPSPAPIPISVHTSSNPSTMKNLVASTNVLARSSTKSASKNLNPGPSITITRLPPQHKSLKQMTTKLKVQNTPETDPRVVTQAIKIAVPKKVAEKLDICQAPVKCSKKKKAEPSKANNIRKVEAKLHDKTTDVVTDGKTDGAEVEAFPRPLIVESVRHQKISIKLPKKKVVATTTNKLKKSTQSGVTKKLATPSKKSVLSLKKKQNKPDNVAIMTEIKNLLYAFGDSSEPSLGSTQLMESILKQELGGFVYICEYKASLRGSKTLGLTEAIVTLMNDVSRINRLYKLFGCRDVHNRRHMSQPQSLQIMGPPVPSNKTFYIKEFQRIIKDLDLFDLHHLLRIGLDEIGASMYNMGFDDAKLVEAFTLEPEISKFYQYATIRSLSFARKLSTLNIRKWIVKNYHIQTKASETFLDILDFLALEIVAGIVDLAFSVRQQNLQQGYSETRVANPDTCMTAPYFMNKRKADHCNQLSEILVQASEMEAIRLKKEPRKDGMIPDAPNYRNPVAILTPDFIREAYMRIQTASNRPSASFLVQANLLIRRRHF